MHTQLHASLGSASLNDQIQTALHPYIPQYIFRLGHVPLGHILALGSGRRYECVCRRVSVGKFDPLFAPIKRNDGTGAIRLGDSHAQLPQGTTAKDGNVLVCAQLGAARALDGYGEGLDAACFAPGERGGKLDEVGDGARVPLTQGPVCPSEG